MNDEYAEEFEPEEQDLPETKEISPLGKSFLNQNKTLKDKSISNIIIFFSKFNGLIDRIYSTFSKNSTEPLKLKIVIYPLYEKLFSSQTKFVMIKGNDDFFLNPINKSFLNEAFEIHQKKTVEFNDESHETTIKLFLRSLFSDPSLDIYLLKMKEFLFFLKESQKNLKKSNIIDNESLKQTALKKYRKLLKKKEGKKDEEILRDIVNFLVEKNEKHEKIDNEDHDFFGKRKINIEEKKLRNLREVFLHYCNASSKENSNYKESPVGVTIPKKGECMNIAGFLAFLRDFKISSENISKPKTLEIFRKNAGNGQEADFESFGRILKKLSEYFYYDQIEKTPEEKYSDLFIYIGLDDRLKIKEKLSTIAEFKPNDLIMKQNKLKELNNTMLVQKNNEDIESQEEEEIKLETIDNNIKTPKKTPVANNNNNEIHKKLNPLNSAKYQNNGTNSNRSKTKSPFHTMIPDNKPPEKSTSHKHQTQKEITQSSGKNQNVLPLCFNNSPVDLIKKMPGKNQLYEKIFQRAQQIDNEEKMKHEERFNKLQTMQEDLKPTAVKAKY